MAGGVHTIAQEFIDHSAGRLVEHGNAPYERDPKNRDSYYVTLETNGGKKHTTWGVDLERALATSHAKVGDRISLEHAGSEMVRLPDGNTAERHAWTVKSADELVFRQLEDRLSGSGVKETTLDYVGDFADRRGILERLGIESDIALDNTIDRRQNSLSRAAHPAGPERGANGEGDGIAPVATEKPAPLVPAIRDHARGVEDVAREKAMPAFDRQWETARSLARLAFVSPEEVTDRLRLAILDQGGDGNVMGKAIAEQPERFGALRGKAGVLGDNKERKQARLYARSVASHVESSADTWQRRLGEERRAETWHRKKRDTIEVPGLTRQSAELLSEVDRIPVADRNRWIEQLRSTPEGKAALEEAKAVNDALRQRFGHSDPRNFGAELARNAELMKQAERIKDVARIVERTRMAELSRDHTLKQELSRSRGLGLSR